MSQAPLIRDAGECGTDDAPAPNGDSFDSPLPLSLLEINFPTVETARDELMIFAKKSGFAVGIGKGSNKRCKYFTCARCAKSPSKKVSAMKAKRKTSSRSCGCMFRCRLAKKSNDMFSFANVVVRHNHREDWDPAVFPQHRRLSSPARKKVLDDTKKGVAPAQTLVSLRRDFGIPAIARDVYNLRKLLPSPTGNQTVDML